MTELSILIADHIRSSPEGKISFSEYMELALYHPQEGYYASRPALIGPQGDFVTSPHLTADFGELLAIQIVDMWSILGHPSPFTVVEMGAGQGLISRDVCRFLSRYAPDCFQSLAYRIIEKSKALIQAQKHQMQNVMSPGQGLSWLEWDELVDDSVVGCFISNELVDAFPVHLLQWQGDRLSERYVSLSDTSSSHKVPQLFQETLGDLSTDNITSYLASVGIDFNDGRFASGYCTEINLTALSWLQTVVSKLSRGYMLTVDYGYTAKRYYSPARSEGTLQCYYQHAHHSNPYIHVGNQDITAHVNFTALEHYGKQYGLDTIGFTQQGLFLMALGLGDRIAALSQLSPSAELSINDVLRRRDALHALINPMGLGNFGVLVQAKGLSKPEQAQTLKGFDIPPI
ncbi:MAG: class I SAM-dependent methyltransferase [Cyanobacteria bacterium P01_F01_bin.150]